MALLYNNYLKLTFDCVDFIKTHFFFVFFSKLTFICVFVLSSPCKLMTSFPTDPMTA